MGNQRVPSNRMESGGSRDTCDDCDESDVAYQQLTSQGPRRSHPVFASAERAVMDVVSSLTGRAHHCQEEGSDRLAVGSQGITSCRLSLRGGDMESGTVVGWVDGKRKKGGGGEWKMAAISSGASSQSSG